VWRSIYKGWENGEEIDTKGPQIRQRRTSKTFREVKLESRRDSGERAIEVKNQTKLRGLKRERADLPVKKKKKRG